MGVQLHRLDGLLQLACAIVIFFSNVEFFALAGALSQLERLLKILAGKVQLSHGQILVSHAGIGHGKVGVELDGALVQRNRRKGVAFFAQLITLSEGLQSLKRRSGNFLQRLVKLLNRGQRLAQIAAQLAGAQTQSIQHLLLARGLLLHLRQRVAGGGVDRLQRNDVFTSQRRNASREHGLNVGALANFPADVAGKTCLRRLAHQFQRLLHLGIRNDIQIRRLAQAHCQRLLESAVEDRITSGVGEVGKKDGIFFGEGLSFAGAIEKTASHQKRNHQQGNRNQYFPGAARRLLCYHSLPRGNGARLF